MNCNSCNGSKHSNFINPKCFFTNAQLSVVKCSNCGLIYLHPRPEKKLGLEYFENAYSNAKGFDKIDYYRDVESIMNRNKSRWELISKLNAPNHKILDFGAGQGYFVKIAQNNNWNANGVEISGEGRKSAKLNLDVNLKSALNELKTSDFGIITLWDVIEHLEDPKQTIIDLCNFLHPNGLIVVETSNIDSVDYIVNRKKWSYWHIDHLFYYSKKSIHYLFQTLNFSPIEVSTLNNSIKKRTTSELLNKLRKMIKTQNIYTAIKMKYFLLKYRNNTDIDKKSLMTIVFKYNQNY